MICGCIPSKMDGTEHLFEMQGTLNLPSQYDYSRILNKVIDQGSEPTCVCCSIGTAVQLMLKQQGFNADLRLSDIRRMFKDCDGDMKEGMEIKVALSHMRHFGFPTEIGAVYNNEYAKVGSIDMLKLALISNGICIGALKVKSEADDFWNGNEYFGGHAIAIIGYNEEGFILRNSWGKFWGNDGNTVIPYEQFSNFMEIWTII